MLTFFRVIVEVPGYKTGTEICTENFRITGKDTRQIGIFCGQISNIYQIKQSSGYITLRYPDFDVGFSLGAAIFFNNKSAVEIKLNVVRNSIAEHNHIVLSQSCAHLEVR